MYLLVPDPDTGFWHTTRHIWATQNMMTSSNEDIFRVTGPLGGEFPVPGEFPAL